jgi:fumarate hydratase class I
VDGPVGLDQIVFSEKARDAVRLATAKGFLRQNSVDSLTGVNDGTNVGPGSPTLHFHQHRAPEVEVRLVLKGGGCENVGAQYSMPDGRLGAGRDLAGVRKVVLDAVHKAQGQGCAPGILGVAIGGDRGSGYIKSKEVLYDKIGTRNPDPKLAALEEQLTEEANQLGIGPMGFGGNTTVIDTKITGLHRLPASYFVTISYMCWAYRRRKMTVMASGEVIYD